MARVRLLNIPRGQERDADGRGFGDDWPLLDLGETDDGTHHYLTTDHAHCSDVADDADLSDAASIGRFLVAALNGRGWHWTRYNPPATGQDVLAADHTGCAVRRWTGSTFEDTDTGATWDAPRWRPLPRLPSPPRPAYVPPPEPVFSPADLDARVCGTCRYFGVVLVMSTDEATGVCMSPACPWDTPKRIESHDMWASAVVSDADPLTDDCWQAKAQTAGTEPATED